jgi:hypothetical protein
MDGYVAILNKKSLFYVVLRITLVRPYFPPQNPNTTAPITHNNASA